MHKNKLRKATAFDVVNTIILIGLMILCLYPFIYVVLASFSDPWRLSLHQGLLVRPLGFTLAGYKAVFQNRQIWTGYGTTLFNLIIGTGINILLTLLAAYGVSRDTMLKKPLTILIVFTMFFNSGIIPRFLVVKSLGLYNTRMSMILPTAMEGIPKELEEAALLDGANHFTILFRIVTPLIKSTLAVLVLYYGVAHWNQWYQALMYIQSRDRFPLQLVLREILISSNTESMSAGSVDSLGESFMLGEIIKYATIIVATVPILAIYPMLQKHFVKGVMVGAVKG